MRTTDPTVGVKFKTTHCCCCFLPVSHIGEKVLFEKPAPLFYSVKKASFEEFDIHPEPSIKNLKVFQLRNFSMQVLIIINLRNQNNNMIQ